MSFDVAADAYDEYMGRFSSRLSAGLADLAGVRDGMRVLDVGCGPGALTGELVTRLGAASVSAVDPSAPFVDAVRARYPGVAVSHAAAETLPFQTATFDAALAQLVVHFMAAPVTGLGEMRRVTRAGGTVAASVWDYGRERSPISPFWAVVRTIDPAVRDESHLPGVREGDLEALFAAAGFAEIEASTLDTAVTYPTFDDWWGPYTRGVGPGGAYVARLDPGQRDTLREACRRALPSGPITIDATAWACRGVATGR